eukprot:7565094-Alexandrium_andersonii.AAC.1
MPLRGFMNVGRTAEQSLGSPMGHGSRTSTVNAMKKRITWPMKVLPTDKKPGVVLTMPIALSELSWFL